MNVIAEMRINQKQCHSLIIIFFSLLFSIIYLNVHTKWWYEDDPLQYSFVGQISDPIGIFIDSQILRHFGTGTSIVPMQLLSYWFDVYFGGISPLVAYIHSILSLSIVAWLLYLTFERYTNNPQASVIVTIIWLSLPCTISIHYFIATRHYIEGFGWSLLACYWLHLLCNEKCNKNQISQYVITIFCMVAALLSKEIYVSTLLTFFFTYATAKKNYLMSIFSIMLALCYVGYRFWMVGFDLAYPVPLLGIWEYFHYIAILPYTFSASNGGYVIYIALIVCYSIILIQKRSHLYKMLLVMLLVIMSALLSVYPTAHAVLATYQTPGTWYRASFIINTLVLLFFGYILIKIAPKSLYYVILLCTLVIVIPGTHYTKIYWGERFQRSELEGTFYLNNPDKLLYSEEDAYWFIPGVSSLYHVPQPHYINKQFIQNEHTQQMLRIFPTIWHYKDGSFVEGKDLYKVIKQKNQPL